MLVSLLRLLLAPSLIAAASLAGRRWGNSVSGWIVGLPLTSGPIAVILALQYGPAFAAQAAFGTMAGALTQGAFALAYGYTARRASWPVAFAAACSAFAAATAAFRIAGPGPIASYVIVVLGLALVIRLLRRRGVPSVEAGTAPQRSDLPVRMALATAWVVILTSLAPNLGAGLAGMLSPFPMYGAILTVFAHRQHGAEAAIDVLRGMLYGLFGFATFFLCEGLLLERAGFGAAFTAALVSALLLQGAALWLMRRNSAFGPYSGVMIQTPEIHRQHHRGIAVAGGEDEARRALTGARETLQRAVDDGRVLTASAFRYREHFFTYFEAVGGPIAHEALFGDSSAFALWPDRRSRFVPMMDIFHCGVPWTREYWQRRAHVEKVEAHVIRIIPEKLASYIFYHYQLQEEQPGSFDKYAVIALNDNLLFYYKEHPFVIELPLRPGALATKNTPEPWHPLMITHFQPWPDADGEEHWRAIETLWTVGLP